MSARKDSQASTKVPEDDYTDSGFLSGPLSEQLHSTDDIQEDDPDNDNVKVSHSDPVQLDSGLDLTISEDLSNINLTDRGLLEANLGITVLESSQPLVNITEDTDQDTLPPLAILFQQDDDGDTQLHIAAVHGCQKSVGTLVRVCPDRAWLNVPNDFGHTALHLAVLSGHAVVTRMLVLAGASISMRDLSGENPLHLAALAGHKECIKALLMPVPEQPHRRLAAILDEKNYNGQTSVHLAAMAGHIEALQILVFYGADINAKEGLCGWTALHLAAARGDVTTATYLVQRCAGVWLEARDYAGRTPFRLARRNHVKTLFSTVDVLNSETDESDDESLTDNDLFEEVLAHKTMASVA